MQGPAWGQVALRLQVGIGHDSPAAAAAEAVDSALTPGEAVSRMMKGQ